MIFSMENYNIHKKRLKQLQFNNRKEEMEVNELIDKVTKPVISHIIPRLKPKDLSGIDRQLRMAKWHKTFTPIQFRAFSLLLKALGVTLGVLLVSSSTFMAGIWFAVLFFGPNFLLKNSITNRKQKLITEFPDFIRITEGYLSANIPLIPAVKESIKYVGDEWQPILQQFVVEAEVRSVDEALEFLKNEVDLFEVREFVSLVRLTLEQGGDASESFSAQADKIRQMQINAMEIKVGKRQTMSMILQGPLLLCILATFALPIVSSMTSFSSM